MIPNDKSIDLAAFLSLLNQCVILVLYNNHSTAIYYIGVLYDIVRCITLFSVIYVCYMSISMETNTIISHISSGFSVLSNVLTLMCDYCAHIFLQFSFQKFLFLHIFPISVFIYLT